MPRKLALAALVAAPLVWIAPASAQNAPINGVLTVFGDDDCPPDVICVRAPENDRYRIPQELRDQTVKPENESWAVRQQSTMNVGATGTGSCSAVGPGGFTGCFVQQARAAKAEREARKAEEANLPLP